MDEKIVLKAEGVSKKFCKTLKHVMTYGALDITTDFLGISTDSGQLRAGEFYALENVSLSLKQGESIALVGRNGSGKSTLLRLLNGIYAPDSGRIDIRGRVGALIAVGAGFHPLLTGRENVFVNGQILGMTRKEIAAKFNEIVEFAELGDFIDAPVKHYSSGMFVRLGFSVAVHSDADILLIDEILAVGDYAFQYKCFEKIKELRKKKVSIVFVSHSDAAIKSICQKGILLDHGKVLFCGEIKDVLVKYGELNTNKIKSLISKQDMQNNQSLKLNEITRRGNGDVRFLEVCFFDANNKVVEKIPFGQKILKIYTKYYAKKKIINARVGFYLKDAVKSENVHVFTGLSPNHIFDIDEGEGELIYTFDPSLLAPNIYGLYIGLADGEMLDLAYDIWDVNGTLLEIENNEEIIASGVYLAKPYCIQYVELEHKKPS